MYTDSFSNDSRLTIYRPLTGGFQPTGGMFANDVNHSAFAYLLKYVSSSDYVYIDRLPRANYSATQKRLQIGCVLVVAQRPYSASSQLHFLYSLVHTQTGSIELQGHTVTHAQDWPEQM